MPPSPRDAARGAGPLRVVFVMEQHIGHKTYAQNMRAFIDREFARQGEAVEACWVEVTYDHSAGLASRLPFLPGSIKSMLAGRAQVLHGLNKGYDAAFFNTQVPAALAFGALRGPYVLSTDITPRQYDRMAQHYGHRADGGGLAAALKHRLNTRLFQSAAKVLPWSQWTARSLVGEYGVNPEQVEVIAPGVDLHSWQPAERERSGSGPAKILFVGGDFERKGGPVLLEAFRHLPPGSAELVVVTQSAVEEEPGVRVCRGLKANAPELLALYRSADIFALPSLAEAFGIAAVEASAAGLPVVASRTGGLNDIVSDGETGFLVEPGSAGELASRLAALALSTDLRRTMGRAARAKAEACYDAATNFSRINDILIESTHLEGKK